MKSVKSVSILFFIGLVLTTFIVPTASLAASSSKTYTVRGTVSFAAPADALSKASGRPLGGLPGALVIIRATSNIVNTASATTDGSGNYTLPNIPSGGPYVIEVTKVGFVKATSASFRVTNDVVQNMTMPMTKATTTAMTTTTTLVRFNISGIVMYDAYSNPNRMQGVTDATVSAGGNTAMTSHQGGDAYGGGGGAYSITGLAPGTYTVTASATNFTTGTSTVTVVDRNLSMVNFTLVYIRGYTLRGTVTGVGGAPISGARVCNTTANSCVNTTPQGTYTITNVTPGTYSIQASDGYTSQVKGATVTNANVTLDFSFPSGGPSYNVKVTTKTTANIAVSGVAVAITTSGFSAFVTKNGTTQTDGSYTFTGIPPAGDFELTAVKDGYMGLTEKTARKRIVVTTSDKEENLVLNPTIYSLRGTVFDGNNNKVSGANVSILGLSAVTSSVPDTLGQYSFPNLPAGTYTTSVTKGGMQSIVSQVTIPASNNTINFTFPR